MGMKCLLPPAFTQMFGYSSNQFNQTSNFVNTHNKIKVMEREEFPGGFQVPLHYPKYSKSDYEAMDDLSLDLLLKQYGISLEGSLEDKRVFAMESFLWPDQL
ncbi:hypothetical protein Bca4012_044862 [Brassica carinata]|uniref:DUF7722 domain-containing protein n=2 Tax=Brassica TaxID=3705 RepID=A0A8X7QSW6_BRACI|nr:uncharacterized protein BNAC09G32250D [Brassica napus]KAG2275128.1 hypothetical protein Bca52824_057683 [Brassica carinata]CAF1762258.1 unnamed protein product [Brassica napus]CDY28650.1 BnaC09g32250D [Brassica napus]